ncbi:glycoside-pentoside-hexuronide (GPH):cation symporter [bacterium]|nr:glycoside-pentoside-hexuronide (GPH):cation symporter [bacterium]
MANTQRPLDNISKWVFSSSGIGRDAAYTLISLFLLVYIQFTVTLSVAQFSALSVIIVLCRVWDAVNDPMMGTIIENTKSKYGKFKPWIIIGAFTNSFIIVALFWFRPEGWAFVAFFGVAYLLWGMTFTINDISWWSMIPALTSDAKTRDQLMTLVSFFANAGAFVVAGLVPVFTTGNAVEAYRVTGLLVALGFVLCQCAVLLFVSENRDTAPNKEKMRFSDMFRILSKNKQLLWSVMSVFLLYLLGAIINSLGMTFFYFEFGYDGAAMSTFIIFYAIGSLLGTIVYPFLTRKFNRAQLLRGAIYMMTLGYLIMFLTGYLPFIPHSIWSFSAGGLVIFTAQAVMYLIILVQLTNTIEYEQYLTGNRNEAILFSLRPLTAKASGAVQQGLVSLILIVSGIYSLSNRIATLEQQNVGVNVDISGAANVIIDQATPAMLLMLRAGITLVPMVLAWITYLLIKKKYFINEETYEVILKELKMREDDPHHFDTSAIYKVAGGLKN